MKLEDLTPFQREMIRDAEQTSRFILLRALVGVPVCLAVVFLVGRLFGALFGGLAAVVLAPIALSWHLALNANRGVEDVLETFSLTYLESRELRTSMKESRRRDHAIRRRLVKTRPRP
jgi:hypothetical protein